MPDAKSRMPPGYWWLNLTQFLGALNDNAFKLLLIFLLVAVQGEEHRTAIVSMASALFVIPFLLFSHAAGVMADRFSKQRIIVGMKWMELGVMLAGIASVIFRSPPAMYAILFLMCTQSALFGPAKYGVIPEIVGGERLSRANSYLVGATYLAIILGTSLPSVMLKTFPGQYVVVAAVSVALAIAGLLASFGIQRTPAAGRHRPVTPFFVADIFRTLLRMRADRDLLLTVIASAYFLFLGGYLQQNLLLYGRDTLHLPWVDSGFLFSLAAIGIGIGALLAGRFSGRSIEFGLVPLSAAGLTAVCVAMGLVEPNLNVFRCLIIASGFFGGMFVVPLDAFIQYRTAPEKRGEVLACQSFLGFLGAALSSLAIYVGGSSVLGLTPAQGFIVIGLFTAILTVIAIILLPDFLVRFIGMLVTRTFYRIRVEGMDNLPAQGAALLVSNHVTWVDALFLSSLQPRRIRFLMSRDIYQNPWLNWLFRLMRAIPISPRDGPRSLAQSFREARAALDDGYLVCIFAEGALTRNGNMQAFRPGWEHVVKGTAYPVIPAYIGGAWGSIFSYFSGRLLGGPPRKIPYPVTLLFAPPLPPSTPNTEVEDAVVELSTRYVDSLKSPRRTLAQAFIRNARRNWRHRAISDTMGRSLTFGRTLAASIALAAVIRRRVRPDERFIGIMLPSSVAGALVNTAVTLLGRTAVNLNVTVSQSAFDSAVSMAGLRTVISSAAFLKRFDAIRPPEGVLHVETLFKEISGPDRLLAMLKALLVPAPMLADSSAGPDTTAAVIFSSGSTGRPKGVMLSHHNLLSNIESFSAVFHFTRADRMCGTLPLFHSFGYTTGLWCPLVCGFAVHYHPNPLDTVQVVKMIRDEQLTILLSTPTFLSTYMRRAEKQDFASLHLIVTGAEKLKKNLADAFESTFGCRPLEGYGSTELSPVVGVSIPDVTIDGVTQPGRKEGSIGHAIPGVQVRVEDPVTGERLPANREGLLWVRGPSVMLGYLEDPARTAEVMRNGWYNTGDIARVDEDGFIFLVDRLSRFSKIGGEMVPHVAIEERILQSISTAHPCLSVTSVPDERKGEQLVVLFTDEAGSAEGLENVIRQSDLPNLWRPRRENLHRVEKLPVLGSGKLDLRRIKELAREMSGPDATPG